MLPSAARLVVFIVAIVFIGCRQSGSKADCADAINSVSTLLESRADSLAGKLRLLGMEMDSLVNEAGILKDSIARHPLRPKTKTSTELIQVYPHRSLKGPPDGGPGVKHSQVDGGPIDLGGMTRDTIRNKR